jgi:hypothetical protein
MDDDIPVTKTQRAFQYQIWLMMAIVFGVILAGFLLVPTNEESRQRMIDLFGTTNQGALVKPAIDLTAVLPAVNSASAPKWTVLVIGGNGCDASCRDVLRETKNVHMLLGKYTGRMQRMYLPDSRTVDADAITSLQAEHPFLEIIPIDVARLQELLAGSSAAWDMQDTRYFVLTPDNLAILFYSEDDDAGGLLEDLKHLLKYSPDR